MRVDSALQIGQVADKLDSLRGLIISKTLLHFEHEYS
jgi:hypothetical protein